MQGKSRHKSIPEGKQLPEEKEVRLPQNSRINKRIIKHLEDLFDLVPPQELKRHLLKIFMLFLINEHDTLPINFEKIVTHYHFLFQFLDIAEEEMASLKTNE